MPAVYARPVAPASVRRTGATSRPACARRKGPQRSGDRHDAVLIVWCSGTELNPSAVTLRPMQETATSESDRNPAPATSADAYGRRSKEELKR